MTETIVYHLGGHGGLHRSFDGWPLPLRYVAFEPDPEEAELLRASGAVEVEEVAIGDQPGPRAFRVYRLADGSGELSSLLRLAAGATHRYRDAGVGPAEEITVELDTLDAVATRRGERPDFLVADVQGAELLALRGAEAVLRESVLAVRLEVAFLPLYEEQPLFADVDAAMRRYGFALARLERTGTPTFGPSTDAGPFSTSVEDARPAWADAVYLRAAAPAGRWTGAQLARLVCFALANGVGSLGLDVVFAELEEGRLADALAELDDPTRTALVRGALAHLDAAEAASVTGSDPVRGPLDASRRARLRDALA